MSDFVQPIEPWEPPRRQVAATKHEDTNFGDHGEFVTRAVEVDPDETVGDFVHRLLGVKTKYEGEKFQDYIVLRMVEPKGGAA